MNKRGKSTEMDLSGRQGAFKKPPKGYRLFEGPWGAPWHPMGSTVVGFHSFWTMFSSPGMADCVRVTPKSVLSITMTEKRLPYVSQLPATLDTTHTVFCQDTRKAVTWASTSLQQRSKRSPKKHFLRLHKPRKVIWRIFNMPFKEVQKQTWRRVRSRWLAFQRFLGIFWNVYKTYKNLFKDLHSAFIRLSKGLWTGFDGLSKNPKRLVKRKLTRPSRLHVAGLWKTFYKISTVFEITCRA